MQICGPVLCALTAVLSAGAVQAEPALSIKDAAAIARRVAPNADPGTIVTFGWHESGLKPWALHDNTSRTTLHPVSLHEAIGLASIAIAQGHSVDLGLMQINSNNLAGLGLTVADAFDPVVSIRAGAAVLSVAYEQCLHGDRDDTAEIQQATLMCATSVYNTGKHTAGIANGYVGRVWKAAAHVIPAIQIAGAEPVLAPPEDTAIPQPRRPPPSMEDALHASPPIQDEPDTMGDALHQSSSSAKKVDAQ